eukprot:Selendium_serpulae@DN957_c0_g1_i1.p1
MKSGKRKSASVFSEDFRSKIESTLGGRSVKALDSPTGKALQVVIFFLMVAMMGLTPIVKINALTVVDEYGNLTKQDKFLPSTVHTVHFGMSVLLANAISALWYGVQGLKDCWNREAIGMISPVSIIYAVGESMEIITLQFISGPFWKILNQLKLPLTAIVGAFALNRKQTILQWLLILGVTVNVYGYFLVTQQAGGSLFGTLLGVFNVLIITMAGILADVIYKKVEYPFVAQMAQGRLSSAVASVGVLIVYCYGVQVTTGENQWQYIFFGGKHGGWDYTTIILANWLLIKDWSVTFVLKNFDSLWKAMGTALALIITFFADIIIFGSPFKPILFMFLASVGLNVAAFSITKKTQADVAAAEQNTDEQEGLLDDSMSQLTEQSELERQERTSLVHNQKV